MKNESLWENFLNGDKDALSALFNNCFDELYGYGLRLTQNQHVVNDSIQDLFLKLWKNRETLGKVDIVRPYLLKALRRHIIANLQWKKRFVSRDEFEEQAIDIVYSHEDFLLQEQESNDAKKKVVEMLNQLPERQKEAIYLRYFLEYDFEMIADVMSMNVQSVRNVLHRGLQSLRDLLPIFIISIAGNRVCIS